MWWNTRRCGGTSQGAWKSVWRPSRSASRCLFLGLPRSAGPIPRLRSKHALQLNATGENASSPPARPENGGGLAGQKTDWPSSGRGAAGIPRVKFFQRWKHMTPARRQRWGDPSEPRERGSEAWENVVRTPPAAAIRALRSTGRTGQILKQRDPGWSRQHSELHATLQAMLPREATLGSITLGRWLKNGLVDAPIDGLVMRSAQDRKGVAQFWIEQADKKTGKK